jgi:hypothetical protein
MTSTKETRMRSSLPGGVCQAPIKHRLPPRSVYADARREAEKHKWLESERKGCDVGQQAIEDWYRQFWSKYCRARRLEHLAGEQQWVEFAEHEFGRMFQSILDGNVLLQDLIERFEDGWENLHFTVWVHDQRKSRQEIDEIIGLLEIININITRLDPRQPNHS